MFWGFPTFETKHLMYITRYLNSIVYGCIYTRTYLSYFIIKFIIWPILTKLFGRRSLDAHFSMHGAQICRCRRGSILQHNFCPKIVMFPQAVFVFLSSGFRFTKHLNQDNQPSNQPSNLVFPSTVFEGTLGVILFPVLRSELFQRCNQRCHEECVISVATTKKMQKSCGHLEKN